MSNSDHRHPIPPAASAFEHARLGFSRGAQGNPGAHRRRQLSLALLFLPVIGVGVPHGFPDLFLAAHVLGKDAVLFGDPGRDFPRLLTAPAEPPVEVLQSLYPSSCSLQIGLMIQWFCGAS